MSPIRRHNDATLRVGIAVDWLPAARPEIREWPECFYAHLAEDAFEHGCVVYLFHLLSVDFRHGRVAGWIKTTSKGPWERRELPLPHAVYNRISRREVEAQPSCRRILDRLKARMPLFNPRFLDKGEVQVALARSPLAEHLPPAIVTRDPAEAVVYAEEFGAAFVKPVRGSLGNGVVYAERRDQLFLIRINPPHTAQDPAPLEKSWTRQRLKRALARHMRKEALIIQWAVPRCRWRGRPFDVRSLVQKDEGGRWRLTGAAGRVAAPGGLTTHSLRGGSRVSYHRLAAEADAPLPALAELESLCRRAAETVDAACGGDFFEFSMDLAIAQDGHPYLLEVNAKPFPFDEEEIKHLAAKRLFAYARAQAQDRGWTVTRERCGTRSNKMAALDTPSR